MISELWNDYLDIETLALVVALLFFLQTIILLAFFLLVNEYDGIGLVSLGGTIYGSGFGIIVLQKIIPSLYLGMIGASMNLIGAFFLLWGITKFCGRKIHIPTYAGFTFLTWLTAFYNGIILENVNLRMAIISFGMAILLGSIAINLFYSQAQGYKIAATLTGLPLLFYSIFLLIRMAAVLFSPSNQSLSDQTWIQILFFLLVFIFGSLWSSGFILMITQRLHYEVHQQARFDILTQCPNRLSMQERLETALAQLRRTGNFFSVFVLDIDYFKRVNDMHGHDVGDLILREVTQRLQQILRPQDSLGRWGGEEFLVILPDTDTHTALNIAERLRTTCTAAPFWSGSISIPITISIGVAVCHNKDAHAQYLLRAADHALYAAKESGRNRVHLGKLEIPPTLT
jgi:diguanylate cyclase (GGDEF)-like protein